LNRKKIATIIFSTFVCRVTNPTDSLVVGFDHFLSEVLVISVILLLIIYTMLF